MNLKTLLFTGSNEISIEEEQLPKPKKGEVLIKSLISAISAGTEMLVYRGQIPHGMILDEKIHTLNTKTEYPLKYGYSIVGRVISNTSRKHSEWKNRLVFSFHPHESYFTATPDDLIPIPSNISLEEAVFLPNMETALSLIMDGRPIIGENVSVFGQGVVGLLTTALLSKIPLSSLTTFEKYSLRRKKSIEMGADRCYDPISMKEGKLEKEDFEVMKSDLTYELSGNPEALEQALTSTGYSGRLVIGSWYGIRPVHLNLGGRFHRDRIRIISSQVSSIDPQFAGRWTKQRRLQVAWKMITRIKPTRLITHKFSFTKAGLAYSLLDKNPDKAIQVLLTYPE
ncbi:zinc-dependent alcohol dehydrogenase [[Eubacterium] cellulosolvens]